MNFFSTIIMVIFIAEFLYIFLSKKGMSYYIIPKTEKRPKEFIEIYKQLESNESSDRLKFVQERSKIMQEKQIKTFIAALVFIFLGPILSNSVSVVLGIMSSLIGILIFSFTIKLIFSDTELQNVSRKYYKEEVVLKFIQLFNKNLSYEANIDDVRWLKHYYDSAKFDEKNYNVFDADDYISGKLDEETDIKMADLHVENTRNGNNFSEIFYGLFVYIKCPKTINNYIKISKNNKKITNSKDKVRMDSQEFEKYFDIYSDNKIKAMQLLTSDVMMCFLDFYNKVNFDYEIIFRDDVIYIRFLTGHVFEEDTIDENSLFAYYCILDFITGLIKNVNKIIKEVEF